ncbi:F-box only protein 21-like [Glandiceps talaboti]
MASPISEGGISPLNLLADEIIEFILCQDQLNYKDIVSFSSTCTRFRVISASGEVWRRKLLQRRPSLSDLSLDATDNQYDWFDLNKLQVQIGSQVHYFVNKLPPLYYHLDDVSNEGFEAFQKIITKDYYHWRFVQDELLTILSVHLKDSLTKKYYTEKVLRFVQHYQLSNEWKAFMSLPEDVHSLEKGAILLAQWCQTSLDIKEENIHRQIDHLAELVLVAIGNRYPDHPLCNKHVPCQVELKAIQTKEVIQCLNTVLFFQEGYSGNEQDYYDKLNSYIDKVLERRTGIPISLSILYVSIAQRLGITLQPVNFPNHFLLRYQQGTGDSEDDYIYIDVFNKGKLLERHDCLEISPAVASTSSRYFDSCDPKAVFIRMTSNLLRINPHRDDNSGLRNALELYLVLCPDDIEVRLLQARVYLHLNINLKEVMEDLSDIGATSAVQENIISHLLYQVRVRELLNRASKTAEIRAKQRHEHEEVCFSVGMIMKHKRYDYICVIYGWDSICKMPQEWIMQMGVYNLPKKDKQPFYNVLVEDGTNRYAAQENLEFAPDPYEVKHPDIGRYFNTFAGTFYIANSELARRYPDDMPVTVDDAVRHYNLA